jgi:hypothetical protein
MLLRRFTSLALVLALALRAASAAAPPAAAADHRTPSG